MIELVATYAMHYGPRAAFDELPPVVERGERFRVLGTSQASPEQEARHLIRNGVAMSPDDWAARLARGLK
jgi:hypothetical protein